MDSYLTLQTFNRDVIEYLKSKGVIDHSKFTTVIDKDQPLFLSWEYASIDKPTHIPLKPVGKRKHEEVFNYILVVGDSKSFFKLTEYEIRLESLEKLDIKRISAQVSFYQDTFNRGAHYDDIVCNIRSLRVIDNEMIGIELLSYRHIQQAWSINHKVFLQIIISDKPIQVIMPIPHLIRTLPII